MKVMTLSKIGFAECLEKVLNYIKFSFFLHFRHYPKIIDHDVVHPVLGIREFDSKTEIDEFHGDPKVMKIQALLITERVLGKGHKDTIFRYM